MREARGLTGKASVGTAHESIATDEEGRRPGVEVYGLRKFGAELCWLPTQQHRVLEAVDFDERAKPFRMRKLFGVFERDRHDL